MRIDRLKVENFKCFAKQSFELHPHLTVFVGENGSGKTAVLDALAVAASVWLVEPPASSLTDSKRPIWGTEIRLVGERVGDRWQFRERWPVIVWAEGRIHDNAQTWNATIDGPSLKPKLAVSYSPVHPFALIQELYADDKDGINVLFPVLRYFGAGRAWLSPHEQAENWRIVGPARRWAAFDGCFNERIRFAELTEWFRRETLERGNRGGKWRPGFEAVRRAVLGCVPGAEDVWLDADWDQIVLSIDGSVQPMGNLSAGQRMMLALVADLAIKCVTQNAYLVSDEDPEKVLRETPGVVLIDELDVHLHPKWQRRVASDLKRTFPEIQFVCTTHSPQIIGELHPEEIRILDGFTVSTPDHSFGVDSSRVLEELMDAPARNERVAGMLEELFGAIDREDFDAARAMLPGVEAEIGADDPEVLRARTMMSFLESGT